ncbi:unnamed protein product [Closterium sp. NIES-53]
MARWAPHSVLFLVLAAVALLAFLSTLRTRLDQSRLPDAPSSAPSPQRHSRHSSYRRRLETRRGNPGRKTVRLHAATAEANPRLDHITFDPLVAEMEAQRDDRKWEEAQFRRRGEEVRVAHSAKPHGEGDAAGGGRRSVKEASRIEAADEELRRLEDNPNPGGHVGLGCTDLSTVWQGGCGGCSDTPEFLACVHVEGDDDMAEFVKTSRERFALADSDGDGLLNEEEFNEARDTDGDMRLSFDEFLESVFEEVAQFDEEYARWEAHRYDVTSDDYVPPDIAHGSKGVEHMSAAEKRAHARTRFDQTDANHDGYLDASEFEDLLYAIVPNEYHFAEEQAKHMMMEADDNKDKRLSLEEMLAHWDVFYDGMDEEGDDSYHWPSDDHDEFR